MKYHCIKKNNAFFATLVKSSVFAIFIIFLLPNKILVFNFIDSTLEYYFSPSKRIFIFYCLIFFTRYIKTRYKDVFQNVNGSKIADSNWKEHSKPKNGFHQI